MGITRDNHYVPRWYLNRFVEPGEVGLYFLDLDKVGKRRPDGSLIPLRAPRAESVKGMFFERDLYTTFFGQGLSDEIERRLFGPIDDHGRDAVYAFAKGEHDEVHRHYQLFFGYLNAQLMRTPKGLSWLAAQFGNLSGNARLMEMQRFLALYCPMWIECVPEIVSAENCKVKFLVTDTPVTIYNPAFPPECAECRFPNDPRVEWIGSQVLFPLGADQLLILTHLQYAKPEGGTPNLGSPRENPRYHGMSLGRTDAFIRGRSLNEVEVGAVNMVLKARARRYVAAGKPQWLHPDQIFSGTWKDVAPILLPREKELWRFGGETYIGFNDGTTSYRDPFGRTSKAHELLKKQPAPADLAADQLCGCGSGLDFEDCCQPLPAENRPAWDVLGIRERNLIFCNGIAGILELDKGKDWASVRRDLSDEQVQRIFNLYAGLWPEDTDLAALLPRPKPTIHRGVLFGPLDARALSWSVVAALGYFDELVLPHPFMHQEFLAPDFNPKVNPAHYKLMLIRFALTMLQLEPLIQDGLVHLVPDLADFNPHFRDVARQQASHRSAGWQPTAEQLAEFEWMSRDDYLRAHRSLPITSLERLVRKAAPNADDRVRAAVALQMKEMEESDPLALLQPSVPGERGRQWVVRKGYGLETASFLAGLVGGSPYCDNFMSWAELKHALSRSTPDGGSNEALNGRLDRMVFPVVLDIDNANDLRDASADAAIRQCFRALAIGEAGRVQSFEEELPGALARLREGIKNDWLVGDAKVQLMLSEGGLFPVESQRLQLQFARTGAVRQARMAMLLRWNRHAQSRREDRA